MDQVVNASAPALRWQVLIDWPNTGVWTAANADVSADVMALRWQWGRRGLPVPEFAPPAELELTLRNHGHRYTPGFTAGPLAANVQPGRAVWLRASRIYDDFTTEQGASANLDGRAAPLGNASWTVSAVAGNGFSVTGGVAMGQGGGWPPSDAAALLDTGDPIATLTSRYRRGSSGLGGFVLRCAARNNCLRLRFASDATILERVAGNTTTRLSDGAALDVGAWYDLEIEQTAGSVRVHAVKSGQANAARREILAAAGIAGAPSSGRHGLWHGFRNAQDRWDDFAAGRSLFHGRVTSIEPDYSAGVCRVIAADVMQRLESIRLHRALAGGLMRSGNVASAILGWAGLSAGDYVLDDGRTLLTGGPRSVWGVSASRALRRLQREEHGFIYADGLGRVRLEAASSRAATRNHAAPTTLARFSITDTAAGPGPYATSIHRSDGADAGEDSVTFRYRRSSDAGRQQVWTLNEALEIPAGGEQQLLAATDAWNVIAGIVAPVAGADYTATDDAAGKGADVTDVVTVGLLTEAQSGIAGKGHALRIRNTGAKTAYLQKLNLTATHCWRTQTSGAVRAESTAGGSTPAAASERLIQCRYADHYAAAESAAKARLAERSRRRPQLEITLPLSTAENRRAALESRPSNVIALQATAQGISGAWLLEGMELNVSAGGEGQARCWLTAV